MKKIVIVILSLLLIQTAYGFLGISIFDTTDVVSRVYTLNCTNGCGILNNTYTAQSPWLYLLGNKFNFNETYLNSYVNTTSGGLWTEKTNTIEIDNSYPQAINVTKTYLKSNVYQLITVNSSDTVVGYYE